MTNSVKAAAFAAATLVLATSCSTGPTVEQMNAAGLRGRDVGVIATGDEPWYVQLQWGPPQQTSRSVYSGLGEIVTWGYCSWNYGWNCYQSVTFINDAVESINTY